MPQGGPRSSRSAGCSAVEAEERACAPRQCRHGVAGGGPPLACRGSICRAAAIWLSLGKNRVAVDRSSMGAARSFRRRPGVRGVCGGLCAAMGLWASLVPRQSSSALKHPRGIGLGACEVCSERSTDQAGVRYSLSLPSNAACLPQVVEQTSSGCHKREQTLKPECFAGIKGGGGPGGRRSHSRQR